MQLFFFLNKEQVIYVETTAQIGDLTVGITESGNVAVEEEEQTFDINISEFSSENEDGFAWANSGGNNPMDGNQGGFAFSFGGSENGGESRELIVSEVFVSAGQEVTAGTPICSFEAESLDTIRNGLSDDEKTAKNTLQERETDLEVNKLAAKQELEQNQLYGESAPIEYNASIKELKDKVEEIQENLTQVQETLAEKEAELTEKQTELTEASKVLENAEFNKDGTDMKNQLYFWIEAENNRSSAEKTKETLEQEIESLTNTIEENQSQEVTLKKNLVTAQKEYDTGKIEAQAVYDNRILKYESAQEIYDTAIASSTLSYEIAVEEYEEAKAKLDEFDSIIVDNNLIATSDGVISDVSIDVGDSIYQGSSIITYNAYEDVSITITLEEEDREQIEIGTPANITVIALAEELFAGEVTEIGDAVYDNDTGINTYEVTITLSGNLEKVFDGMSAEVTLITENQKNVLYVNKRAVTEENDKAYVKVKSASGKVSKTVVKTGFSDGVNIEIIEGLSEGDTVLIESKVSDS